MNRAPTSDLPNDGIRYCRAGRSSILSERNLGNPIQPRKAPQTINPLDE